MFPAKSPAIIAMVTGFVAFCALAKTMADADPVMAGPAFAVALPLALSGLLIWRMFANNSAR